MDEPHAQSLSDEVDENENKFRNNKAKVFDRFYDEVLEAILYLRGKVQVLIDEFGKIMNMS
jgi:hypothetical protein